jgi:hypothetical protein
MLSSQTGAVPMKKQLSLRDTRPPEPAPPQILAMSHEKRVAAMRALIRIAMERGAAKTRSNPGLARRH